MNIQGVYMIRTFGVEIEFIYANFNSIRDIMQQQKLSFPFVCSTINRQPRSNGDCWHLKFDASVVNNENGVKTGGEIASPAFTIVPESFIEIKNCIEAINNCKSKPFYNDHTGFHVHINIDDIDRMKLLLIWLSLENEIYKLFPTRQTNIYTKPLYHLTPDTIKYSPRKKLNKILNNINFRLLVENKNSALRFYTRNKQNFLEIRLARMFIDPNLLIIWIKICLQIIEETKQYKDSFSLLCKNKQFTFKGLNRHTNPVIKLTTLERLLLKERLL